MEQNHLCFALFKEVNKSQAEIESCLSLSMHMKSGPKKPFLEGELRFHTDAKLVWLILQLNLYWLCFLVNNKSFILPKKKLSIKMFFCSIS